MIDFEQAIEIAKKNAQSLIENAQNFVLEGVLLSNDDKSYEVSLSYDIRGNDPLGSNTNENNGLHQLARLLSYRREYKVFIVDSMTGKFKGFINQKK